jgi:hypothetical protein
MKKTLLFFAALLLLSCSKDSDSSNPENPNVDPSAIAYFKANFNGQPFNYVMANETAPTHVNQPGNGYSGEGSLKSFYYASYMLPYPQPTNFYPRSDISFNHLFKSNNFSEEVAAFPTLLTTPPSNFLTEAQDNSKTKGLEISYRNENNVNYSTLFGSQTGSAITYQSSVLGVKNNIKVFTITGTFNCKLYSESNPADVITVTNGAFKLDYSGY